MDNHEKIKLAFSPLKAPEGLVDEIVKMAGENTFRRQRHLTIRGVGFFATAVVTLLCLATASYAAIYRSSERARDAGGLESVSIPDVAQPEGAIVPEDPQSGVYVSREFDSSQVGEDIYLYDFTTASGEFALLEINDKTAEMIYEALKELRLYDVYGNLVDLFIETGPDGEGYIFPVNGDFYSSAGDLVSGIWWDSFKQVLRVSGYVESFDPLSSFYSGGRIRIDEGTADKINDSLKGKLFDFYGKPVEAYLRRLSETADWGYAFYPVWGSGAMFDYYGCMILDISWNSLTEEIELLVSGDIIVYTYAEAAALLGHDFGVPDVPGFSIKLFQFMDHTDDFGWISINAFYINEANQVIDYTVDVTLPGGTRHDWRQTGEIDEVVEINGVTVFIQRDSDVKLCRYFWQVGDVSYCLFTSTKHNLSENECLQVIASMLI